MASVIISSIGKKLLMSIAGIFLILFLLVHMGINLLVILFDDPMVYNRAAHFMSSSIVIKVFEILLFGGFLLHILYALILQVQNWLARPKRHRKYNFSNTSFFSKFMIHTAAIIGVFLVIHLIDFYFKAKFGKGSEIIYEGVVYHDFAGEVIRKFQMPGFVIFYILSFLFLGFHLLHGFQSAFKTFGLYDLKYARSINILGLVYTIIVVTGFSIIPIIIYFTQPA
ncbi:MAG: succinate dehydrogenase cytochrome b subunit [Bacteroidales bacterium]|nr:succinate dehydrogenase cytochrome b subunit [Bacteroidales bacterium]MBN2698668.1 succinate dehydrogenase cytochrome b subunit [Bacteroidales bacterium]